MLTGTTVTVIGAETDSLPLEAVNVYVVVVAGETVVLPFSGCVPSPEIETELAPLVVQLNVEDWPG
jgi:hypothetical protein